MKPKLLILTTVMAAVFLIIVGSALAKQKEFSYYPPHYKGWICIHNREAKTAGWQANTGNGYFGGLQMSYNWENVIPGKASNLPAIAQMWAAELIGARSEFSYSFMSGQWPNTFPPCSSYF